MIYTGWIIYNGSLQGNKFLDFAQWLQNAATRQGSKTSIIKNNDLLSSLDTKDLSLLQFTEEPLPDYVISTDKDLYLARQFELLGIPVFNSANAIEMSDDKIQTHQMLALHHIPMPLTIVAPKVYTTVNPVSSFLLEQVEEKLKFPLIIKEAFGSFGEQVYLIHNRTELIQKTEVIGNVPYLFQEFIKTSSGRDLRLQVVGNHVVAAMKRTAVNDFRANVTNGGKMQLHTPTESEKKIAIKATKAIGADFAGVDLLYGENEAPLVCEINSNAHIHNLFNCTGINCADAIVEYILNELSKKEV